MPPTELAGRPDNKNRGNIVASQANLSSAEQAVVDIAHLLQADDLFSAGGAVHVATIPDLNFEIPEVVPAPEPRREGDTRD